MNFPADYRDQPLEEPDGDEPRLTRCHGCGERYRQDTSGAQNYFDFCSQFCETETAKLESEVD